MSAYQIFVAFAMQKTSDEIFKLYQDAMPFIESVRTELRACSQKLKLRHLLPHQQTFPRRLPLRRLSYRQSRRSKKASDAAPEDFTLGVESANRQSPVIQALATKNQRTSCASGNNGNLQSQIIGLPGRHESCPNLQLRQVEPDYQCSRGEQRLDAELRVRCRRESLGVVNL